MLSDQQRQRYRRNILLSGIGEEGQHRLLESSVVLVGVGGLGSPAAFYLAAAGLGRIGLIDADIVDVSNLNRQVIHSTPDIGRTKVESAVEKLIRLNSDVMVEGIKERLTDKNALDIISGYDIVVDCTDNFKSRFIINKACFALGKPFIYGGVLAYLGQVMTVVPHKGPCFNCLYRSQPERSSPDCTNLGVLGTVAGVIGALQACEAIKYLSGVGELLVGRLLTYDALSASFNEAKLEKDPYCPTCGAWCGS